MSENRKHKRILTEISNNTNRTNIKTKALNNGMWDKIILKNNNSSPENLENYIRYDDYIEDYSQNNKYILNRENLYNDYNMSRYPINRRTKIPNNQFEYGNVIEERRNYKLYISGIENSSNDKFKDDNKNNINNNCFNSHYFKAYKCNNNDICNQMNDSFINSKIKKRKRNSNLYSPYSNNRRNSNYIYYSSPTKKIYKSPYYLKNKGIIKDNIFGNLYKVFEAVPISTNDLEKNDYKLNNRIISPKKENNINYMRNNDIQKEQNNNNFIFKKPILKMEKYKNSNKRSQNIKVDNINNKIIGLEFGKKIKSLYFIKKSYSSNCKGNNFISKKIINNKKNNLNRSINEEKSQLINNTYIEINESNSNKKNNKKNKTFKYNINI